MFINKATGELKTKEKSFHVRSLLSIIKWTICFNVSGESKVTKVAFMFSQALRASVQFRD